ncbi:MAG: hypothetical protein ACJAXN_003099 [Psychromonas sp.]|jgi:hypothetical protein
MEVESRSRIGLVSLSKDLGGLSFVVKRQTPK